MYHSGHPYTHAGSPGEKDKDCGKGKNKSELQGLGELRKGVKTDADKLRGADFTWLKKKQTVSKSRLPGNPMVQECKQVDIQIMGTLSKAGVGALTRMKHLQTWGEPETPAM